MRHLVPFTKDQLSTIKTSLWASTKYSDAEHIEEVQTIIKVIEENSSLLNTRLNLMILNLQHLYHIWKVKVK